MMQLRSVEVVLYGIGRGCQLAVGAINEVNNNKRIKK